jgi:hypothetical protein
MKSEDFDVFGLAAEGAGSKKCAQLILQGLQYALL